MALTKEDLQAIQQMLQPIQDEQAKTNARLDSMEQGQTAILEQQEVHTKAIMSLENNIMHELKVLNELLPDALAKREAFEDVAAKVDDHGNRIFSLEQKVANG